MHRTREPMALADLQRWLLQQVSGDDSLGAPSREIEEVVLPSRSMTARERLSIYEEMYFSRLFEALADDYPGVAALLGDERFEVLAREYFEAHPPSSFTLAHVGRHLPAFLGDAGGDDGIAAREVARVELAITEAFSAPTTERLRAHDLAEIAPEQWPRARFRFTGGLRLLESRVDVHRVLDAASKGEPVVAPEVGPCFTVVWRRGDVVWRRRVTRPMFRTLESLASGGSIADALEAAIDVWNGDESELTELVFAWFGEWLQEGLFSEFVPPQENQGNKR